MKEILISAGPKATLVDTPIPKPAPGQIVIRTVIVGANPKDWKYAERFGTKANQGEDIAGVVHEVGEGVVEFKVGDRVAALHEFSTPYGAYAEFSLAWAYTSFHIPPNTSFEEAATIPLSAMTACMALFSRLPLPQPWSPVSSPLPLVIYGASSAVGCYAIQLAKRANIHPLICVAGKTSWHAETLIDRSKGDTIIDHRVGPEGVVAGIKQALRDASLPETSLKHAFDVISEKGSWKPIVQVLDPHGSITNLRPIDASEFPSTLQRSRTGVAGVHSQLDTRDWDKDFGYVFFRLFGRGLEEGWLKAQPFEVRKGGLNGVEGALRDLKEGRNNGKKYVVRIADTEGLS
ncbi:hypothetical protein M409DRAFT_23598 [Zasmidium cellare ATCC 36951]|uniref:Enoyl reductase (ER) domain-containing protein n=1 Tax=Zasmidium cellare ATCC 36951 TaxID=1080233 RepID=A0A6A6CKC2_ZASCE|nr:uncharacterized protein M409DRAFT_23598 [Zasmidium cellare ATCC 36951]KAF2165866.1 hypothetical protein M409DRAFT_23598 [Zasmidium cellare ATCC 36951]